MPHGKRRPGRAEALAKAGACLQAALRGNECAPLCKGTCVKAAPLEAYPPHIQPVRDSLIIIRHSDFVISFHRYAQSVSNDSPHRNRI